MQAAMKHVENQPSYSRMVNIFKNITLEPAMFILSLSSGLSSTVMSQMIIYKSCKVDFGFNDTVCDDENLIHEYKEGWFSNSLQVEKVKYKIFRSLKVYAFGAFFWVLNLCTSK